MNKLCSKSKHLTSNFGPDKRASDGLQSQCRDCMNKWHKAHPRKKTKEQAARHRKKWYLNNIGKKNASIAKRHAAKLQRTPKWLTAAQLKEIEQFYIEAKELRWLSEEPLEVDHIVPLQGKNVSGLHVPWNLQILPMSLNVIKGNKYE